MTESSLAQRRKSKVSTNDYVRKVLVTATRENWEEGHRLTKKKQRTAERLGRLYGYNAHRSKSVRILLGKSKSKTKSNKASPAHSNSPKGGFFPRQEKQLPNVRNPSVGFLDSVDTYSEESSYAAGMTNVSDTQEGDTANTMHNSTSMVSFGELPSIRKRSSRSTKKACQWQKAGVSKEQPWYFGYQNSPAPVAYSLHGDARRYGFAGAQRIEKKLHEFERTINYQKHSEPTFLGQTAVLDEFVDSLRGPPGNWPAFSMYVCGSKLKEYPERPDLTEGLSKWLDKSKEVLEDFNSSVFQERSEREKNGVGTLVETDSLGYPKHRNNKLLQDARRMKYTTGLTVLYSDSNSDVARRENLKRLEDQQRLRTAVRWREQLYLYNAMRSNSNRRPGLEEFHCLVHDLESNTQEDGFSIDRKSFVVALLGRYDEISARNLNQLYSCYDPERLDVIDFRFIVIDQRCLWMLEAEPVAMKLAALFNLFCHSHCDAESKFTLSESLVHFIFATVCLDADERKHMKEAVNAAFGMTFSENTGQSPKGRISRRELLECIEEDERKGRTLVETFSQILLCRLPEELRKSLELA